MASDQQLAPVHGATAEKQTKGRGALPKAYPKTAEGLQRLDADIKERGAPVTEAQVRTKIQELESVAIDQVRSES